MINARDFIHVAAFGGNAAPPPPLSEDGVFRVEKPAPVMTIVPTPFTWRDPASIPTRQWLYGRHLIRRFVSATIAAPGVGKSTLGLAEDVAMATGRALLGQRPDGHLRVWSWNGEDPLEEMQRRVAAICLHYGVMPEEIGDRLFLDSGREKEIIIASAERNGFTIAMPVVSAVKQAIGDCRLDVLRIDPFVSCHRVIENDNNAIDGVVKQWAKIADETNCAIELVHHSRKTGGAEVSVDDARGASALLGAVRSARALNVMTDDEAARTGVENRRTYFRVDNGKSNLAPPPDKGEWFHIVSQGLGNGAGGPQDMVGVAVPWQWPNALDGLSVADLRKVQERISEGEHAANVQATNWAGYAVAEALGIDISDKAAKERVKSLLRTWIANKALRVETRRNGAKGRDQDFIIVGERV